MASKSIKQTITGKLHFNHLDPHFARFNVEVNDSKPGESELYGFRPVNITPDMFPEDFELSKYDITGKFSMEFEITPKKVG